MWLAIFFIWANFDLKASKNKYKESGHFERVGNVCYSFSVGYEGCVQRFGPFEWIINIWMFDVHVLRQISKWHWGLEIHQWVVDRGFKEDERGIA